MYMYMRLHVYMYMYVQVIWANDATHLYIIELSNEL